MEISINIEQIDLLVKVLTTLTGALTVEFEEYYQEITLKFWKSILLKFKNVAILFFKIPGGIVRFFLY